MLNLESTTQEAKTEESVEAPKETSTEEKPSGSDGLSLVPDTLLAGKYKTVTELESGYKEQRAYVDELRKEVETSSKTVEVPNEYKLDFSTDDDLKDLKVDMEDPQLQTMFPIFKDAGLSQDQVNKIMGGYYKDLQARIPSVEEEKKKLGPEADVMIDKLTKYASQLSKEDQTIMQNISETATGVDFMYRFLVNIEKNIPSSLQSAPLKTGEELVDEAFEYRRKHETSIGFNKDQQQHYDKLMKRGLSLQVQNK